MSGGGSMTRFMRHGTSRCLLCDFQGGFLHWGGSDVGDKSVEVSPQCGFETSHVLERIEIPSEELDTLGVDLIPMDPLSEERPMM